MNDEFPFDEEAVPEPNPEIDVESLADPPSADDFFLFERIDGATSVEKLCTVSGLGREETLRGLQRLCESGLVDVPGYDGEDSAASDSEVVADESSAAQEDSAAESDEEGGTGEGATKVDLSHLPIPPEEFEYDESLLEADLPLADEMKRELMCLAAQLDELDHYQFFGVDRDASQKDIKMAYFRLSKRYHPDKHFGDPIGAFEEMLEAIFQRVTRAYRTLSNPDQREEYDEELAERDADDATPMNRPSSVRMATEEESPDENEPKEGDPSESGRRNAAFLQLLQKGEKLRKQGEFLEAADAYRKALAFRRELEVALQAARVLLKADKQHDQAELFARAALRIEETSVEARMLLGRALEKQERNEEALGAYDSVLRIEPEHDEAETRREEIESG